MSRRLKREEEKCISLTADNKQITEAKMKSEVQMKLWFASDLLWQAEAMKDKKYYMDELKEQRLDMERLEDTHREAKTKHAQATTKSTRMIEKLMSQVSVE